MNRRLIPVVLAALMVLMIITTGAAGALAAEESAVTVDRTIEDDELAAGEGTTVTVEVELDQQTDFTIVEELAPSLGAENVEIVDADGASFAAVRDDGDEVFGHWSEVEYIEFVYEVTVPQTSDPGDEIALKTSEADDIPPDELPEDTIDVVSPPETGPFIVADLDLEQHTLDPGESTTVAVAITNEGDTADTTTAAVLIDDEEQATRDVEIGPDSTTIEQFEFTAPMEPGGYTLVIETADDEATSTLNVNASATPTPTPTLSESTPTPDEDGIPGPGLVWTLAGIAGAGYMLKWWGDNAGRDNE